MRLNPIHSNLSYAHLYFVGSNFEAKDTQGTYAILNVFLAALHLLFCAFRHHGSRRPRRPDQVKDGPPSLAGHPPLLNLPGGHLLSTGSG